jgi:hypothetical protein
LWSGCNVGHYGNLTNDLSIVSHSLVLLIDFMILDSARLIFNRHTEGLVQAQSSQPYREGLRNGKLGGARPEGFGVNSGVFIFDGAARISECIMLNDSARERERER